VRAVDIASAMSTVISTAFHHGGAKSANKVTVIYYFITILNDQGLRM
jgi:hypothetical protein